LLNLFLALAMFDVWRELVDPRPRWRRRAFLWIALGVLTKGPVALLIPAAASFIAFLLQDRLAGWWRAVRDAVGWAILLAVAGPWYVLEYERRGDAFLAGFFMRHNVERFLVPLQGHAGGVFYYVPALVLLVLPYTGLLLATLPGLRRLRASPLDTVLWCWFLFVFVFFTLAGTKLPHYLLYGATPLFILMARGRHAMRNRLGALLPALLLAGAVAALPFVLDRVAAGARNLYVREALSRDGVFDQAWAAQALAVFAGVLVLALWPDRWRVGSWPRVAAAALLCSWALGGLVLPAVAELQQGPVKRAALLARQSGWNVRSWRINAPSFSVYRAAVTPAAVAPRAGDVILTRSDALDSLPPLRVLFREGGVLLVRIDG
jgi:4-amino-4-deoxy-L-arabinose transferase-like glycosyltransferase